MEKRELYGDKNRYTRYLPSSSTLQIIGEKLDFGLRRRLERSKVKGTSQFR